VNYAFKQKLENTIADMELSILSEQINADWMHKKRAKLSLIPNLSKSQEELLDRIKNDLLIKEEQVEGLTYALNQYKKKLEELLQIDRQLEKENAH